MLLKENSQFDDKSVRNPCAITDEEVEIYLGQLEPKTFPPRHNTHKYWGKKPANVFSDCIKFFSQPNEVVLDPFNGSGITAVESVVAGRKAIGYDLNPIAIEITSTLINHCNVDNFAHKAHVLIKTLEAVAMELYGTTCRKCGKDVIPVSFGWEKDELISVRYKCDACKTSDDVLPNEEDTRKALQEYNQEDFPDRDMLYGWEMQKLKRANIEKFSELFTPRNFRLSGLLSKAIQNTEDESLKNLLRVTFTANLANCTRMIADFKGKAGGPSWKINCYWLPTKWQELNVLHYFNNRVKRTSAAIIDLRHNLPPNAGNLADIRIQDSQKFPETLLPNSVDYILTDPPYGGEGIQYGELSMLWNLWLGHEQDLSSEIAMNPYRKKGLSDYAEGLTAVFKNCYKVLRPGRWMSVTFNNKDTQVWESLLAACKGAGFDLRVVTPLRRSAPALTEHTTKTTPKMDVLLHFQKPLKNEKKAVAGRTEGRFNFEERTGKIARVLIEKGCSTSTSLVLNTLTIEWLSHHYKYEQVNEEGYDCLTLPYVHKILSSDANLQEVKTNMNKRYEDSLWNKR